MSKSIESNLAEGTPVIVSWGTWLATFANGEELRFGMSASNVRCWDAGISQANGAFPIRYFGYQGQTQKAIIRLAWSRARQLEHINAGYQIVSANTEMLSDDIADLQYIITALSRRIQQLESQIQTLFQVQQSTDFGQGQKSSRS